MIFGESVQHLTFLKTFPNHHVSVPGSHYKSLLNQDSEIRSNAMHFLTNSLCQLNHNVGVRRPILTWGTLIAVYKSPTTVIHFYMRTDGLDILQPAMYSPKTQYQNSSECIFFILCSCNSMSVMYSSFSNHPPPSCWKLSQSSTVINV
jgi:hypothetical protein